MLWSSWATWNCRRAPVANRAISINNLREDAHRLAIPALAAAGRRADALKRYEHLVALLKSELDVEPDANTQALARSLRQPNLAPSDPVARGDTPTRAPPEFPPLPDRPSIAVLPFANMSGDPEQEYFADGMVEDILTALSRVRWLFVIARQSSFSYKGRAVDVKQIGRELGVRYVTEGSVRKFGNRVRVTAQLIDAETGAHLWADRFEGMLEDVFELQDDLHRLSRVPSSRRCKRRSIAAQSGGRPMTSPHTTLYCALALTPILGKSKI